MAIRFSEPATIQSYRQERPADWVRENPNERWLTAPDDWTAHIEAKRAEQRAAKIEKLRAELAELESTQ